MYFFFFFNDTATTEIYTLSLHDALPIWSPGLTGDLPARTGVFDLRLPDGRTGRAFGVRFAPRDERHRPRTERSEEHTSELQSPCNLVCRLLLEKKKK